MQTQLRILAVVIPIPLFALVVALAGADAPMDCGDGVSGNLDDSTWSGDVYVDGDVNVRAGATLTITAGTNVWFCGEHRIAISAPFSTGQLVARGTAASPIRFLSVDGVPGWEGIFFNGNTVSGPNILEHLQVEAGGAGHDTETWGAVHVSQYAGPAYFSHLQIADSRRYGLVVEDPRDPYPPAVSDLTITGSAAAPLHIHPDAISGLAAGATLSGNAVQRIQVPGATSYYDQRWRPQPLPYEILGTIAFRNGHADRPFADIYVEAGVDFLLHPGVLLSIGNNGSPVRFRAEGSAAEPVTFDWAVFGEQWRSLAFDSGAEPGRLYHVEMANGGGEPGVADGMVTRRTNDAPLELDNVVLTGSSSAAVYAQNGRVTVRDSVVEGNHIGLHYQGAEGLVRGSVIQNNGEWGLLNEYPNLVCIDARGNNWGVGGPLVTSTESDACGAVETNGGATGSAVSAGVLYGPWLAEADQAGWSSLRVEPYWVALGQEASLEIELRDANGQPLANRVVRVEATMSIFNGGFQEETTTDADGGATVTVSSDTSGFAHISAVNVTDDVPLAAFAGANFWEPEGDSGGLTSLEGVPYAFPGLEIRGRPFQQGMPIHFRMPMRNSNPYTIHVTVTYGVSGFGIGDGFRPVSGATASIPPNGTWDAPGGWVPGGTGHGCATGQVGWSGGPPGDEEQSGEFERRVNLNLKGPASPPPCTFDCWQSPGLHGNTTKDLTEAGLHLDRMLVKTHKAVGYINDALNDDPPVHGYETVAEPLDLTLSPFTPGPELSAAEAEALTEVQEATAALYAMGYAIQATSDRLAGASMAQEWQYANMQRSALDDYLLQEASHLRDLAAALAKIQAAMQAAGAADVVLTADDFLAYRQQLADEGFAPESVSYYQQLGLTSEQIDGLRQSLLEQLNGAPLPASYSLYEKIESDRQNALKLADDIEAQVETAAPQATAATQTWTVGRMTVPFVVGNPTDSAGNVDLALRPVSLPADWTYTVDDSSPYLETGETTTVTLTLQPGATMPADSRAQIAVEGYKDGELVGGILVERRVPAAVQPAAFLPFIVR